MKNREVCEKKINDNSLLLDLVTKHIEQTCHRMCPTQISGCQGVRSVYSSLSMKQDSCVS
jgi:hypothetical protein